jgi:hypothetical protein
MNLDMEVREGSAVLNDPSFVALEIGDVGAAGIVVDEVGGEDLICYGQVSLVKDLKETEDEGLVCLCVGGGCLKKTA